MLFRSNFRGWAAHVWVSGYSEIGEVCVMGELVDLEELIRYLLYLDGDDICVGVIGDVDISDCMPGDLRKRVRELLKEEKK